MSYYSTTALGYSPLGYWRLGESVFPTAFDATSNHYDGIISGGVSLSQGGLIAGNPDTAMLFDGNTGQITLPLVTTKTANILLIAWVTLPTATGHGAIIKIGDGSSGYGIGIGGTTVDNSGVHLIGLLENVAWIPTTVSLSVGVKHQVAMVFTGGNCLFFLDGTLAATVAQSGGITPATACYIGTDIALPGRHLNALIDEPGIYDVTGLTVAQISAEVYALYRAGGYGSGSKSYFSTTSLNYNPLGYWRLGEPAGSTAFDTTSNYFDGAISGGVTPGQPGLIAGDPDTAMLLDGNTGQITLPLVTTKTANILLAAWVTLPTALGHGAIIKIGDGTSGYALGIGSSTLDTPGTNIVGNLHGVANISTTVPLTVGIKHQIGMVFTGGNCLFYLDGALVATVAQSVAGAITPVTACYIGTDPTQTTRHLNAVVDEASITDVTGLTVAQITAEMVALYQAGQSDSPPIVPPGTPNGYLLLIGGKDRTPHNDVDNLQITVGLQDRMPQVEISVYDSLCQNPINIFDEVVIIDQATTNPTHNYVLDPNLLHSPAYTTTNIQPTAPNSATGNWTLAILDTGVTITTAPLTITLANTPGNPPILSQWTQPHMVTPGVLYMFSAQLTVLSALVNAAISLELDFYDSTAKLSIGFGHGGGVGGFLGSVSQTYSTSQRATLSMVAPAGAAYAVVNFTVQSTVFMSNSGSVAFTNLQLEPVWFPYLQPYPTPFCGVGQNGCTVLPNGTAVRQKRIFAGIVSDADPGNTSGDSDQSGYNGPSRTWDVNCKGANWILDSILVAGTYTAQQDYQIISSVVLAQLANMLTINNVDVGSILDQRAYDDQTFTDVLNDLCNATGFVYYVDNYYDLHYISIGTEQAIAGLSDNPDGISTFAYQYWSCPRDGNSIQNSVIVKGAAFIGSYTDSWTASGSQKQFSLTQLAPTAIDSITVNGVLQTDGIDGVTGYSFSNCQVLTNFPGHFIRFQNNITAGQVVTCTYKYNGTVRVVQTDLNSVAKYKGLVITGKLSDTTITTTAAAMQRALEFLNQFSTELISPHFKTLLPLYPGQVVPITNAEEGFSSKPFIVQQVIIVLLGNGMIEYEATCGSDVPTFTRMHHRMHKITTRSKLLPGDAFSNIGLSINDSFAMGADSASMATVPNTKLYDRSATYGTSTYA